MTKKTDPVGAADLQKTLEALTGKQLDGVLAKAAAAATAAYTRAMVKAMPLQKDETGPGTGIHVKKQIKTTKLRAASRPVGVEVYGSMIMFRGQPVKTRDSAKIAAEPALYYRWYELPRKGWPGKPLYAQTYQAQTSAALDAFQAKATQQLTILFNKTKP